jgi:hypothetical protein
MLTDEAISNLKDRIKREFPIISTEAINYSTTYLETSKNILLHHSSKSSQHIFKKGGWVVLGNYRSAELICSTFC